MLVDKTDAMFQQLQPILPRFHVVVQLAEQPAESPLLPDSFVRIDDGAIAVKRRDKPTEIMVRGMAHPEWQHIVQQSVAVTVSQLVWLEIIPERAVTGCVIVTGTLEVHKLASRMVTVWFPAGSPLNVPED